MLKNEKKTVLKIIVLKTVKNGVKNNSVKNCKKTVLKIIVLKIFVLKNKRAEILPKPFGLNTDGTFVPS